MNIDDKDDISPGKLIEELGSIAGDVVIFLNTEGNVTLVGGRFTELTGYEEEEVIGKNWNKEILPELKLADEVRRKFHPGEPGSEEFVTTIVTEEGRPGHVLWKSELISHGDGETLGKVYTGNNLTEYIGIENLFQDRTDLFQILFSTLEEGVILINPNGEIVKANPAAESILGLDQSELTGRNYVAQEWNVIRPDGTDMPAEEMAGPRAMKEEKAVKNVEMGLEQPNSSINWINVNASPVKGKKGQLKGIIGTFTDITKHKEAVQTLEEKEGYFKELHGIGVDMLGMENKEQVLQSAIEAAEHVLDLTRCNIGIIKEGELIPSFFSTGTDTDKLEKLSLDKDSDRLVVETALTQESKIIKDLQRTNYLELTKKGFRSAITVPIGNFGVFEAVARERDSFGSTELEFAELISSFLVNVIDRLEAESEYKTNQERLNRILAKNPAVVYLYSIDEDKDIEINYVNDKVTEVLGYKPEEIIGHADFHMENFHPGYVKDFEEEKIPELMEKGSIETEYRYRDVSGDYHWLFDRQSVLGQEDGVTEVIGAWQDITERKKAEEERNLLLENTEEQVWYLKDPKTYGRANQAHADFLGREISEIENTNLSEISNNESEAQKCIAGNEEVFESSEPIESEEWVENGEGEKRLLSINKYPKLEAGEVKYVICTAHDITERRYQSNLHHLISQLTTDLIATDIRNLDEVLNEMLEEIGKFVGSDRAYLFQFTEDGEVMNNTHEWCAEGIMPQKEKLQDLPSDTFPWWMKKLESNEDILVPVVSDMKNEARNEQEILEEQNIKSVIVVPVNTGDNLLGFVGFDAVGQRRNWTQNIASLLHIFATAIANSLSRRREKELKEDIEQLKSTLSGVTNALSSVVGMRDAYTAGHQENVAEISVDIARKLGFSKERIEQIRTAALLHDIGKISTPPAILNETGELNEEEYEIIKRHPMNGYEILSDIDYRGAIAKIVLQHHERLDGSGYPNGLTSEEILPEAKILAVADAFEAMTSHRPYRPAYSVEEALKIMNEEQAADDGLKFDENSLRALKQLIKEENQDIYSD